MCNIGLIIFPCFWTKNISLSIVSSCRALKILIHYFFPPYVYTLTSRCWIWYIFIIVIIIIVLLVLSKFNYNWTVYFLMRWLLAIYEHLFPTWVNVLKFWFCLGVYQTCFRDVGAWMCLALTTVPFSSACYSDSVLQWDELQIL